MTLSSLQYFALLFTLQIACFAIYCTVAYSTTNSLHDCLHPTRPLYYFAALYSCLASHIPVQAFNSLTNILLHMLSRHSLHSHCLHSGFSIVGIQCGHAQSLLLTLFSSLVLHFKQDLSTQQCMHLHQCINSSVPSAALTASFNRIFLDNPLFLLSSS